MATKKPLVITDGNLEQLQAGDNLAPVPNSLDVVNGEAFAILIGASSYIDSANTIKYANADSIDTKDAIGLCTEEIAISGSGVVQVDGLLILTTAQWDIATGDTGGLTPGAVYFLSDVTIGRITKTATTTTGHYIVKMGIAVSTTDFEIMIGTPIKL